MKDIIRHLFRLIILYILCTHQGESKNIQEKTILDSRQMLDLLRSIKNPSYNGNVLNEKNIDIKCGFWLGAQIMKNWDKFSPVQQKELSVLMTPSIMENDTIVGHFRIHYYTSGDSIPALLDRYNNPIPGSANAYVDSVARIFNEVWDAEIEKMGYETPPFQSGNQFYDIYITDMNYYGITWPIGSPVNGMEIPPKYISYIEIDNDYSGNQYYTHGMNGLKVTAAHEFHHAIQYGYGFWENDTYAYELTSTWFEDVVYPEVNDYVFYLPEYFSGFSSGISFNSNLYGGYERCVWAHFLAKRFGQDIMRDVWTLMKTTPFLESTNSVLTVRGASFQTEFGLFTYWNYFTGYRADTSKYYPDGKLYPLFETHRNVQFVGGTSTIYEEVGPLSSSMCRFVTSADSITAIIANVDVLEAERRVTATERIDVKLSSDRLDDPYLVLANGLKAGTYAADQSLWRSFFIQSSTKLGVIRKDISPNPFILSSSADIYLPFEDGLADRADVFLYTLTNRLVYSGRADIVEKYGSYTAVIPASDIKSRLASGIYFVIAKTAVRDHMWKLAVIR